MPLLDRFLRPHTYLRIAVTDRCNLRCVYCAPASGVAWVPHSAILTFEEIVRITKLLSAHGIEKARLTGGEPLVRADLDWLVRELSGLPQLKTLAMTTNGTLLRHHAKSLRANGLQRLNVSLDTLRNDRFRAITGRDALGDVLAGLHAAYDAGFARVKVNVVVMGGVNDDELLDFTAFARSLPLDVRFIEFMPFPGNSWSKARYLPWHTMFDRLRTRADLRALNRDEHGVARVYALAGSDSTVSFISPISDEFCANCNRLRLTADGSLKSCLLYPAEVSLREALRAGATDEELLQLVTDALAAKHYAHPPLKQLVRLENRCMSSIGG